MRNLIVLTYLLVFSLSIAGVSFSQTPKNTEPEEIMRYAERGANLIVNLGEEKAFSILTDHNGPWVNGQWYLFVNSFEGFVLAHLNKKLLGKTLLHIKDVKGNAFYAELQRIGQSEKGKGWAKYWWPRSKSKQPEIKAGFILRVPGKDMWIGTGVYGLTESQIDKLISKYNTP